MNAMRHTVCINKLQLAAGAGIVSLLIAGWSWITFPGKSALMFTFPYILVDIVGLICFVAYLYGFVLVGKKFSNRPIIIASYVAIVLNILLSVWLYTAGLPVEESFATTDVIGLALAISMIVIGWNVMMKLQRQLGALATWYGALEIVTATGVVYWFAGMYAFGLDLLFVLGSLLLFQASKKH